MIVRGYPVICQFKMGFGCERGGEGSCMIQFQVHIQLVPSLKGFGRQVVDETLYFIFSFIKTHASRIPREYIIQLITNI